MRHAPATSSAVCNTFPFVESVRRSPRVAAYRTSSGPVLSRQCQVHHLGSVEFD